MSSVERQIEAHIDTPGIVVDMAVVKENIKRMQALADHCGCALRPHIKTHKSVLLAKMQIEAGAKGITCAKLSEAEVMLKGGINDIFVAYPIVGAYKLERAVALHKRAERLILAVDCIESAEAMSAAAVENGIIFETRMEIDTGLARTGVIRGNAVELAKQIVSLPGLMLTGIYTFKSLVYADTPTTDRSKAGIEEAELLAGIFKQIKDACGSYGYNITDISAGSTPTAEPVAMTGLVNEIRPGTYIYNDYMMLCEDACAIENVAAYIYASVVSTPGDKYAIIDGGSKAFPTDIILNRPPYNYQGYAIVSGREDLRLDRLYEEHGVITSSNGVTGLHVGDILKLMPVHICPAINLQNEFYILDGGQLKRYPVDARGMLV